VSLQERKSPLDRAPDWVDDMCGMRVAKCVMHLVLYGALTETEGKKCGRVGQWSRVMKGTSTPFGHLTARDYFHYKSNLWRVIMQEGLAIKMDDGAIEAFEPVHHVLKVEVKIFVEGGE